jgi:hypothetical protein
VNRRIALSLLVLAVVVLALAATACGSDDPYSGTWSGSPLGSVTIQPANSGWWSIKFAEDAKAFYGVDMDGMLQTGNGGMTFKPSGDELSATFAPETQAVVLSKE